MFRQPIVNPGLVISDYDKGVYGRHDIKDSRLHLLLDP